MVLLKILHLSIRDAWALAQGTILLLAMPVVLSLLGFPRLYRWALGRSRLQGNAPSPQTCKRMQRTADLVSAAGRRLLNKNQCLGIALALLAHPDFKGTGAVLRLGVMHEENLFRAHAWVELDGTVMGDVQDVADSWRPLVSPS